MKRIKLKNEYVKDLYDTYPDAFEFKESNPFSKYNNNNFIKYYQMKNIERKYIIQKIWVTYMWYMTMLFDTLDYSNRVDFWYLKEIWISDWMIKVIRKKLKDSWFIKKVWYNFYLDPKICMKWESLPPFVASLFDNH